MAPCALELCATILARILDVDLPTTNGQVRRMVRTTSLPFSQASTFPVFPPSVS